MNVNKKHVNDIRLIAYQRFLHTLVCSEFNLLERPAVPAPLSIIFCILCFIAFSGNAQQTTEQDAAHILRPHFDFIATDAAALMQNDQYTLIDVTLDAGSEYEREHQFPVFAIASKQALSMGTFYLLSDTAYNGAHIHSLLSLATHMSELGWNTVVVPAPQLMLVMSDTDAKQAANEAKLAAEQNAEQASSEQSSQDSDTQTTATQNNRQSAAAANTSKQDKLLNAKHYQSRYDKDYQNAFNAYLTSYLLAVIDASAKTGYQVLFAQGLSAQALLNIEDSVLSPDAIIVSNVYWPERDLNNALANALAQSSAPVLDLVSAQDNFWALNTANARKVGAKVAIKSHYRQRHVSQTGQNSEFSANLAKEIYGWLTYLGW